MASTDRRDDALLRVTEIAIEAATAATRALIAQVGDEVRRSVLDQVRAEFCGKTIRVGKGIRWSPESRQNCPEFKLCT